MPAPYPDELRLSLTSPSGASFNIEWKTEALEYRSYNEHFDPTDMARLKPSAEAWAKFWQALEVAGIWEWQARYSSASETEGIQWQVALRLGDRTVHAYGVGAFPGEMEQSSGPGAPTPQFHAFLHGVKELIGGLPFE